MQHTKDSLSPTTKHGTMPFYMIFILLFYSSKDRSKAASNGGDTPPELTTNDAIEQCWKFGRIIIGAGVAELIDVQATAANLGRILEDKTVLYCSSSDSIMIVAVQTQRTTSC